MKAKFLHSLTMETTVLQSIYSANIKPVSHVLRGYIPHPFPITTLKYRVCLRVEGENAESQSHLNRFPVADVTHYHTLSGLKQQKFIILHFWNLEVGYASHWVKIEVSRAVFILGAPKGDSIFLPIPAFRGHSNFLAVASSCMSKFSSTASLQPFFGHTSL